LEKENVVESSFEFIDRTGQPEPPHDPGTPVVVPREAIEAEAARLASLPRPDNGRRASMIRNPATGIGNGLAQGTAVSLMVLKPGERTKPIRHNSSQVNFCIQGGGYAVVGGRKIRFDRYDVWNIPSWTVYEHVNDSNDIQVRLVYSNSALLEKLNIHIVDENPPLSEEAPDLAAVDASADSSAAPAAPSGAHQTSKNPFGTFELSDGAYLMPYEQLINPDVVPHTPLHWPWALVKQHLDKLAALGKSYVGRRLYLLYNPATGRTNGTTNNFFATITIRPPSISDKPHRHTAAAINYFFSGSGYSVVDGRRYTWKSGDLMLTAPGWAIHNHSSNDESVYELTIQDSPLNIAMGSLMWQEDLKHPAEALGATGGFSTNREAVGQR
jgi:gentisate 1,2-dioxygenase